MNLPAVRALYKPELTQYALTAPTVQPLRVTGWNCEPFEIQSRGITWLFAQPQAYVGDVTGSGKTIHGVGLAAVLYANGEAQGRRLVYTCLAGNVGQWIEQFGLFLPGARVVTNKGLTKVQRRALYNDSWDVLITSYNLMWRDKALLAMCQPWLCFFDEASAMRSPQRLQRMGADTQTAAGARSLAANAARVVCADATHIQTSLGDIFPQLEVMGLAGHTGSPFGNEWEFKSRYIRERNETIRVGGGKLITKAVLIGYDNLDDFNARFWPHYLRRTDGSADMPELMPPEDIPVELLPRQVEMYRKVALGGEPVGNKLIAYQKLTAGTATFDAALGDHSAKLDWIMAALHNRLVNDDGSPAKVIIFSRFLATSLTLARRLDTVGIGYGFIDGPHAKSRDEVRHRFWDDPTMRVVIGTAAMKRGHNLQIAKYAITIDLVFNPADIEQIIGRVKRSGSPHKHVFLLRLITPDTFEPGALLIVRARQDLADRVNGDVSELFANCDEDDRARLLAIPGNG